MKWIFLIVTILHAYLYAFSQDKIKIGFEHFSAFGSAVATGLPSGIDRDGGFNYQTGLGMSFHLKPGIILQTGIVYQWSKFSMDGYFTVENNNTIFKQTPSNYKQHSLIIDRINLPLKVKKVFDEQAAIGVGIINSYIVSSASKYKIGDTKYEIKGVSYRRYHLSPVLDIDLSKPGGLKKSSLGVSVQYQVTSFTHTRSFKPLHIELTFQNQLF